MAVDFIGFDSIIQDLTAVMEIEAQKQATSVLQKAAEEVETYAKDEIGILQPAVGPYPAWEPNAPSTVAQKGHSDPLIGYDHGSHKAGTMRDDIHIIEVTEDHADVGIEATDESAAYAYVQELGSVTKGIPARPFMGPAAWQVQKSYIGMFHDLLVENFHP